MYLVEVNRRGSRVPVQRSGPDVLSTWEKLRNFAFSRSFLLPLKTHLEPAFRAKPEMCAYSLAWNLAASTDSESRVSLAQDLASPEPKTATRRPPLPGRSIAVRQGWRSTESHANQAVVLDRCGVSSRDLAECCPAGSVRRRLGNPALLPPHREPICGGNQRLILL